MPSETIPLAEFLERVRAQGAPSQTDAAFRCVVCNTVQSMRSFLRAGASTDLAERMVGFSCVGRLTGAGPWREPEDLIRAGVLGCDWTCGGLFGSLGRGLVVVTDDGAHHARFYLATPAECAALGARQGDPFRPAPTEGA